jgi:hypothetical protein
MGGSHFLPSRRIDFHDGHATPPSPSRRAIKRRILDQAQSEVLEPVTGAWH